MAKFEDVLPALRAGKKVRRAGWTRHLDKDSIAPNTFGVMSALADDWEIVPEPKRVADYFVPTHMRLFVLNGESKLCYIQKTYEVGTQPDGAVLVPGSEREDVQ